MGRRGTKAQRPLFVGAGIIAANLPDLDLAYSWITPPPIGYLLHHRGHTHTVVGLVGLALVLGLAYRFLPSVRKMRPSGQLRFWLLIAIALASHLAARQSEQLRRASVLSDRQHVVLRRRRLHPGAIAVVNPRRRGRVEWTDARGPAGRRAADGDPAVHHRVDRRASARVGGCARNRRRAVCLDHVPPVASHASSRGARHM